MNEIRLGFIGSGPIAALHAKTFADMDGVSLAVCASRKIANAQRFAAEQGFTRATTIDALITDPQVDALVVVVPAIHMHEVAIATAATRLPLLMEKPVGMSLEQTLQASDAIKQPNMVAVNRRFYEVMREGRALVDAAGGARCVEVHMPEDVRPLLERYDEATLAAWHFGNSIHLVDLFRYFAGEVTAVRTNNEVRCVWDRSYCGLLDFASGASGIYNAQWYAPGPWRVTVYADDLCLTFAPVEQGVVLRSPGRQRSEIKAQGPDTRFKPGFYGQAEAFCKLVRTGSLVDGASDLADYARSVKLMHDLTATQA